MSGWVLIVGATSGIGRALARKGAQQGYDLILAGRDVAELELAAADLRVRFGRQVRAVRLDVLAFESHAAFFATCIETAAGNLRGLILCHGQLTPQAEAQKEMSLARQVIDTNFTSAVTLIEPWAAHFEQKKSGWLCVFSSVAGDRGRQSNYLYGSAKAGLTAYLQGLRSRLFKSRVNVLTVKPGFVDTAMTWGLPGMFLVATPERVADDVWKAIERGGMVLYTPWFWRFIMMIICAVPERIFRRLKL